MAFTPTKETIWNDPKHPLYGITPDSQNEEYLANAIDEMRKYERMWPGMSAEWRKNVSPEGGLGAVRNKIKRYEKALSYIKNGGDSPFEKGLKKGFGGK